jgi:hypothetical protein
MWVIIDGTYASLHHPHTRRDSWITLGGICRSTTIKMKKKTSIETQKI